MIRPFVQKTFVTGRSIAAMGLAALILCAFTSQLGAEDFRAPEDDASLDAAAEVEITDPASIGAEPGAPGSILTAYSAGPSHLTGGAAPATGGVLLKLITALILVLALILLLQRAARKWGGSFQTGGGPEAIRIVSSRAVGPRMSLALVHVMNRTLLVGISPQGIRQVADLGLGADLSAGVASVSQQRSAPASTGIWGRLTGMLSRDRLAHPVLSGFAARSAGSSSAHHDLSMTSAEDVLSGIAPVQGCDGGSAADEAGSPPGFEGEFSRRLAELRRRYITLSDLEGGLEGGRS